MGVRAETSKALVSRTVILGATTDNLEERRSLRAFAIPLKTPPKRGQAEETSHGPHRH